MRVTWNLTDKLLKYRKADILVLSVAKSGRTWLRVLVAKYLSLHFDVEFSILDLYQPLPEMPKLVYGHERWSHIVEATFSKRLSGRYVVPEGVIRKKRIVMFYRDPRDVVVSLFFEKTKRAKKRVDMNLPEFIRNPIYGIDCIVDVMNDWHRRFDNHPACLWKSYEGLKEDTARTLYEIIDFMGIPNLKTDFIDEAVRFARFDNMRRMEANGSFNTDILRPGNARDSDSFKVREGKVGGYAKHFDESDLEYLDQRVSHLHSFFGYS